MIEHDNMQYDWAGLWEMGIILPLSNMGFTRFEGQNLLSREARVGATSIFILGHSTRIKPGSRIYIGPSSDPSRNTSGDLISFGKTEAFRIGAITAVGDEDRLDLLPLETNHSQALENNYVAGDPFVSRPIAESWEFLSEDQFAGINTILDPRQDTDFLYSREDSLDQAKGFSQGISTDAGLTAPIDVGISQALYSTKASVLQLLQNKPLAVSAWIRAQTGYGMDPGYPGTAIIDPYVICSFYDAPDALKAHALTGYTFVFGTSLIPERTYNVLISDRVLVPTNPSSMRFGVYGTFQENPNARPLRLHIDDAIVEHAQGTSQESNGRYTFDTNPAVGLSSQSRSLVQSTKDPSGIVRDMKMGDPRLKLTVNALWKNKPSFFINDMRQMENWNKMGYAIALRAKMPGVFPNVMFCNMDVDVDYFHTSGQSRGDVQITFSEVTV